MTPDAGQPDYRNSRWALPNRSLTGGCMLVLGLGTVLYMVGRFGNPHRVEMASVLWVIGLAAVICGAVMVRERPRANGAGAVAVSPPSPVPVVPEPVADVVSAPVGGEGISRVRELIATGKFPFELIEPEIVHDDTGKLVKYALKALVAGSLSDRRQRTLVIQKLQEAVPGDWLVDPQPVADKVVVTLKQPFPSAVPPPLPMRMVTSPQEASDRYDKLSLAIGVDELGEELRYRFVTHHHWLVIGGTGSGKSVFVRALIEELRANGVPLFIGDGKGSDYAALAGAVNVPMISSTPVEHVRLVHAVTEELDRRRKTAAERKLSGHPNPFEFVPWVVILDEFARMRAEVRDKFEEHPGKDDKFIADLEYLFKVAREFRIHIIISTQDLYAKTVPRDILGNCKLVITLGSPSPMTLKHAFTLEMAPKAQQIGDLISADTPGRGLVAIPDDAKVQEFQSYWGYSPGVDIDAAKVPDPQIRVAWRQYKEQVSDVVPKMYGRQWFRVEEPEELAGPMSEIFALDVVNLDTITGEPDPAMYCYDKARDEYNGLDHGNARPGGLLFIDPNATVTPDRRGTDTAPPPPTAVDIAPPLANLIPALNSKPDTGEDLDIDEPDDDPDENAQTRNTESIIARWTQDPEDALPPLSDKVRSIASENLSENREY